MQRAGCIKPLIFGEAKLVSRWSSHPFESTYEDSSYINTGVQNHIKNEKGPRLSDP
jgi:hypothetical protein